MITTYHRPSQHIVLNQHPDQLLEAQPKKNFSLAFNPGWELHHACFFGIKSFSPADCKEILLKDKVTKYLLQKFFKFLWPLLHKKFNTWHVSVKIRKKRPMSKLILADQGSWDDRMFVVKVYCYGKLSP